MHKEVKEYKDSGNIKGLRYIFMDCLDVDPTFEKYREDYDYCQGLPGLFEDFKDITPFTISQSQWDSNYWNSLKRDLEKNFSKERFEHMQEVAKVVYAEKIARLSKEREEKAVEVPVVSQSESKEIPIGSVYTENARTEKLQEMTERKPVVDYIKQQEEELAEARRRLALENEETEKKIKKSNEEIEQEKRRYAASNTQSSTGGQEPKKGLGIVPIMAIIIVAVLIILLVMKG